MTAIWANFSQKTNTYDYSSFAVTNATTDKDVKTDISTAFDNQETYSLVEITTDQTISVKFNSTSNPAITITSTESPYVRDDLIIEDIFISNASGSTANIKIYGNFTN